MIPLSRFRLAPQGVLARLDKVAAARPGSIDDGQCARFRPVAMMKNGAGSGRCRIMTTDTFKTWALVTNGARCRILRGVGGGEGALAELVLRCEARNLRDIMSDKAGRSFVSKGGNRRSALAYASDPIAEDRREFIRQIIALLESHRRAGEFSSLAVFAEHNMLGHLRQMMPQTLVAMVICEVPKNLLHLTAPELAEAVSRAVQDGSDHS